MSRSIRYCRLKSASPTSLQSPQVSIEVVIVPGIPRHTIVGLAQGAVKESLDRIRAAILSSGFRFPRGAITVNLAPVDTRKEGTAFDLPIALGILAADGQIATMPSDALHWLTMGELALNGRMRPVKGVMPALVNAMRQEVRHVVLPSGNVPETGAFADLAVCPADSLVDAIEALAGLRVPLGRLSTQSSTSVSTASDFAQVLGQLGAIRALEVAAVGNHNVLLSGPPGCGKTLMARSYPSILPVWNTPEALETTCIRSLRRPGIAVMTSRPFRSPHHSVSEAGMLGGGNPVRPGEVSLAHNGVLFMDELPEFSRDVLEGLREPLEEHSVAISRAGGMERFPARFQLLAAMNPCPCGYAGVEDRPCRCSARDLSRYRSRLSGPLLDRIDIHVVVPQVRIGDLSAEQPKTSQKISARVQAGRAVLSSTKPVMGQETEEALIRASTSLRLSMRGVERCRSLARSIAALDGSNRVARHHISEAMRYCRKITDQS